MPAPYHSMHRKLENVIKAFLQQNEDLPLTVYTYLDAVALGEGIVEPFIGIRCQSSSSSTPEVQLLLGTGSRNLTLELRIRSHALHISEGTDPLKVVTEYRIYHDDLVGKVIDCFMRADLIDALNALCAVENGIEVEQVEQFDMTDEPQDRSGVTQVTFPITCHPKDWTI